MENNRRPKQVERAIAYMREHGSITSLEALTKLGILSFPKRICEMKEQGFYITSKWEHGQSEYGNKFRAKRYFLIEENEVVK